MEHLSREQVIALLTQARAVRERDWVLFLVAFWHGLRASEAVSLTAGNFADGYLNVQRLKGSLRTVQPLVEHESELLNEKLAVAKWMKQVAEWRSQNHAAGPLRHYATSFPYLPRAVLPADAALRPRRRWPRYCLTFSIPAWPMDCMAMECLRTCGWQRCCGMPAARP